MKSRLWIMCLRALIGYAPPRWYRPRAFRGAADMVAMAVPAVHHEVADKPADPRLAVLPFRLPIDSKGRQLEAEAEQLQRDVAVATIRNSAAKAHVQTEASSVRDFEERARETLRDMLDDMGNK